jgi:polysaccharide export outer membrane protein
MLHSSARRGLALAVFLLALIAGLAARAQETADYRFNPGDVVRISVWREEVLDRQALVQPDGTISFPLAGQVAAAGRTAAMVQEEIARRLDQYIPDAVVTVELLEPRGNKIYVIGEVNRPGEYQLGRPITVVQAISLAGGFTPFAGTGKIRILRKRGAVETVIPFDYGRLEGGSNLEANIELEAGDTVIVPGGSLF